MTDVLMNRTSVMEDVENGAYTVSDVTGATTLSATYAIDTFAITVSQGAHGTISPGKRPSTTPAIRDLLSLLQQAII